ncbi:hypothetical protein [Streptomyces sp. B6B3]|uniref:hypothetical protein n=1 Tax=Streptomyces sp. B6B3 TaxID=3153570 RepID=UPI00325DB150
MTAPEPTPEPVEPIERLLAEALRAGADAVTAADLRPARPPSLARRHRVPFPVRRTAVALFALAAAVAAVLFLLVDQDPPAPPADPPNPVTCEPTDDLAPDVTSAQTAGSQPLPENPCPP